VDQVLELAITRRIATGTQKRMRPQQEHELHAPAFRKLRRIGGDLHAFPCRIETSRHRSGSASGGHFHHAKAASPVGNQPFVVTEGRNPYAGLLRGLQNGGSTFNSNFDAVDGQGNHRTLLTGKMVNEFEPVLTPVIGQ